MAGCRVGGTDMSDEAANRTAKDADRRLFLEKAGRFAAVTPPVVALMLSASGKARATGTTSGATTKTTTTTTIEPSDIRLKRDIVEVDRLDNGVGLYRYRYQWSDQTYVGVMAQEVAQVVPDAVMQGGDGYLRVDYGRLGLRLMTWDEWVASRA
jgi:hypothetical protein